MPGQSSQMAGHLVARIPDAIGISEPPSRMLAQGERKSTQRHEGVSNLPAGAPAGYREPMVEPAWKTSSYSNSFSNCVEVARLPDGAGGVRDSKEHGKGPVLRFTPAPWAAFTDQIKAAGLQE